MSGQPQDPKSPKTEAEKKVPETVLLTAEELRAIAGGAGVSSTPPPVVSKGIVHGANKPNSPLG
jgi:hypothetical protein